MTGAAATVARDDFLPALALVTRAVERRNTIPILSNVLMKGETGRLNLVATDLDIELSATCTCAVDAPFETTLPAANLHDIVRKLPEGCQISLTCEDHAWEISGRRSKFHLPCLQASDFPQMQHGEFSHSFTMDAAALAEMINTVRFAISTEETRYYLNGIHIHDEDGDDGARIIAVTTDGHRLAKFATARPDGATDIPPIIIPRKTSELVTKLLQDKAEATIHLSASKVKIEMNDGTVLVSKLIDGTFPDYRRVIPSGNQNRFFIDRQEIYEAIDRVVTISPSKGNAVRCVFDAGELRLSTTHPDVGSAEETLPAELVTGQMVEIGFNGKYCLDMLSTMTTTKIEFALGDAGAPALIRPIADGDEPSDQKLFVLMPMRV